MGFVAFYFGDQLLQLRLSTVASQHCNSGADLNLNSKLLLMYANFQINISI